MSDTPRTDAEMVKSCDENDGAFLAEDMMFFARELERELAAAKSELKCSMSFEAVRAKVAERRAELERENARLRELLTEALAMAEAWEDFEGSPATDFVMRMRSALPNV